ncbi:MAG: quinate 5-dehydrogenase [bacterium]
MNKNELNCVSVSLGSSKRDKFVSFSLKGYTVNIYRIGVDGDFLMAQEIIRKLQDEDVDAISLGGIDLLLFINQEYFVIKDAYKLYKKSNKKPVVDGSITKRILEPFIIKKIIDKKIINPNQKVLVVSSLDRFESLRCFLEAGFKTMIADMIFALKVDKMIFNVEELKDLAKFLLPDVLNLPFNLIYPTGKSQGKRDEKIFNIVKNYDFDIVVGDFHYINKILDLLKNKIVITNTLTDKDIDNLRKVNVGKVVTTGVFMEGRSFGANVMDCIFAAYCYKNKGLKISPFEEVNQIYLDFLKDFLEMEKIEGNVVIDSE